MVAIRRREWRVARRAKAATEPQRSWAIAYGCHDVLGVGFQYALPCSCHLDRSVLRRYRRPRPGRSSYLVYQSSRHALSMQVLKPRWPPLGRSQG